jgi:type I restriction enzyme S subunit
MKNAHLDEVPLRSITRLITKGTTPTTLGYAFTDSGVNFIKAEAVTLDGRIDESVFVHIDGETHAKLKRSQIEVGDILFSIAGMKLGKCGVVKSRHVPANTNQAVAIIRPDRNKVLPAFLHYYFLNPIYFRYVNAITAQAAQPNINLAQVGDLPIKLPPLATQRRIAAILESYDELIENSQRRIGILETMARSLYRAWFVNFRFPGHEKGKRVPSALGQIPEGWKISTFDELYITSSGGTPSRQQPEYFLNGTIDWVKSQELKDGFVLSTGERITEEALRKSSAKVFPAQTVLIALYGATIGKLAILSRPAATNQACCAVLPTRTPFGREFAYLTLLQNRERIIGLRLGAAQQNISQLLLKKLECIIPPDDLVQKLSDTLRPAFDLILTLQLQIRDLRQTRDLLLPRLLSGELAVAHTS